MKLKFKIMAALGCILCFAGCGAVSKEDEVRKDNPVCAENVINMAEETDEDEKLNQYLEQMSIEEKIGQMFIIAIRKDENGEAVTGVNGAVLKKIRDYHVGGIILFSENIVNAPQIQKLTADLQSASSIPLYIGVDEEGGIVSRIGSNKEINKVPFKEAYAIGQIGDADNAYEEARKIGKLLGRLGFNMDFAPVADIYNEPDNTVIWRRSFGKSEKEVTPMVLAFVRGLKEEGIQPVVKHFPGHGNTIQDSHQNTAYVNKSMEELEKEELIPFNEAVLQGVGAIMKGHLLVTAVDKEYIVSLSEKWKDYMESHYDLSQTLVMTDAMDMGAVTENYGALESSLLSIEAGNDIILMPDNLDAAYKTILSACKEGKITEERINQSVRKILSKKAAQKILVLA